MRFIRDYTINEKARFERLYPERNNILMDFVSKWSTESIFNKDKDSNRVDNNNYIISISIPKVYFSDYDYGCAIIARKVGDILEVLETIMF